MSGSWPFEEPKDMAVFTTTAILAGEDWVYFVTHDDEDGFWQFHGEQDSGIEGAKLSSLEKLFTLEPRIAELANLPLGWCAWRDAPDAPWQRKTNSGKI